MGSNFLGRTVSDDVIQDYSKPGGGQRKSDSAY